MRIRTVTLVLLIVVAAAGQVWAQQQPIEFSALRSANARLPLEGEAYNVVYINSGVFSSGVGFGADAAWRSAVVTLVQETPGAASGFACYPVGNAPGDPSLPEGALSISQDLSTATLTGTFACIDPGATQIVVSVSWSTNGRLYTDPFHGVSRSPFGLFFGQYMFREHSFAWGTLTVGGGTPRELPLTEQGWDGLYFARRGSFDLAANSGQTKY